MASIDKRSNGKWMARWREYPGGPQRYKSFARKEDAKRFLTKVQHDLLTGGYVDPTATRITLADYAEQWMTRMRPTWAPGTVEAVEISLRCHVLPVLGRRPLPGIQRNDIEALYRSLPLASGTVRKVHQHVGQVLNAAVEDGVRPSNPARGAKLPRPDDQRARYVPADDVAGIESELPDWLRATVTLGAGGSLRRGEALGLAVRHVDFLRRCLHVDRQLVAVEERTPVFGPLKTDSSARTVPLGDPDLEALAEHLQRYPCGPDDLVLRRPDGSPISAGSFDYRWRRACISAGAPAVRFHDLRGTFATDLLSGGVSVNAVATYLGHADPAVTLRRYGHAIPADDDRARAVLNGLRSRSARSAEYRLSTGGEIAPPDRAADVP